MEEKKWLDQFDVRLSLKREKFATGGFRDAFECTALSGLKGRFVLKKYKEDQVQSIIANFGSEQYLDGDFRKYINNTGEIIVSDGSDLALKSEMFSHYTYIKSGKRLMVLDIQGAGYSLCDPEIASAEFTDTDDNIFFCNGNLSHDAIYSFVSHHVCNQFCKLLHLHEK